MKTLLFGIIILIVTLSFTVESGKLSGLVTHGDSYGLANQADAGCEIYAISEADLKSTQYVDIANVIGNFQRNKSQYSVSVYNTIDPVRIKNIQDSFDALSNFAFKYISGFKKVPAIVKTVTNGTGKYTIALKPGKYFILVISGSLKSNNIVEYKGNVDIKITDVKASGESFLDFNFEKQEMIWIKLITSGQINGC